MGEHTETVAAGCFSHQYRFRSCETHHVSVSPQEDRRRPEGTVGKG
jgi:hypothetical protein